MNKIFKDISIDRKSSNFTLEYSFKDSKPYKTRHGELVNSVALHQRYVYVKYMNDGISAMHKLLEFYKNNIESIMLTDRETKRLIVQFDRYSGFMFREDTAWTKMRSLKYLMNDEDSIQTPILDELIKECHQQEKVECRPQQAYVTDLKFKPIGPGTKEKIAKTQKEILDNMKDFRYIISKNMEKIFKY